MADETEQHETIDKHPELVVRSRQPYNGGPPPARQRESFLTPNDLFFVRNHAPVPRVDRGDYRLRVGGLVESELSLSLADLAERFRRVDGVATLQCAGQRRQEMAAVAPIPGELPWDADAISTARWGGWRLADVLAAAGVAAAIEKGAAHAGFTGLDLVERGDDRFRFGGSIPLAKALSPEVLLADTMNGEPLPPTHGGPLRVVVPGYIGARSVKWVSEIELRETSSDNHFQARSYRLYPNGMTAATADPDAGFELGELSVNSLIAEPAPGTRVTAGPVTVRGFAFAGGGRAVVRVDLSTDGGARWTVARLLAPPAEVPPGAEGWAWRFFEAELDVPAGEVEIVARAWDAAGNTQPEKAREVWNYKGYMSNAWSRVCIHSADSGEG